MTIFTVKMLGAVIIAAATVAIVWLKIREKRKSLCFVTDFISALKYVENLISFSAAPFLDILKKTVDSANESMEFFKEVEKRLESTDNPELSEVWDDAIDLFAGENRLSSKTVDIIKRLGSHLGAMSIEIETENLSLAQKELSCEKERLMSEFEKEAKLLKSLGMAFGGFIILIFI